MRDIRIPDCPAPDSNSDIDFLGLDGADGLDSADSLDGVDELGSADGFDGADGSDLADVMDGWDSEASWENWRESSDEEYGIPPTLAPALPSKYKSIRGMLDEYHQARTRGAEAACQMANNADDPTSQQG